MNIKIENSNSVLLCCGKKGCPSLRKKRGYYLIKDDFGNEIKLEKEHLEAIPEALKALKENG